MSDALIACSASVRDHVVAVTGAARDAFDVVHNGADLARFSSVPTRRLARRQLGLAQNAKLIGMVGRIAPEKGQLEFVAAADLIARTHSDARFVIAGSVNDAEYAQKVQALIREHGLGERMALSGFVQNVSALYAALNVVVVPSLREGFGLSVLEAMAAARPIVASDVDGISEIVSDSRAAWLVPAGDTHALARAVTHVLGEREETRAMCVRARQVAQHFTWARAAQRLDAIYRRISSPRASLSTVGDQVGVAG